MGPFKPEPVILTGSVVRLRPLRVDDAGALLAASHEPDFELLMAKPEPWSEEGFARYISDLPDGRLAFAVERLDSGRLIGTTSLFDVRPEHRGLEIGYTWYAPDQRGTKVNPECKLLLMQYAFETLGALRVQMKTDARNERSQRAMAALGATREGVLRRHMVTHLGHVRDTVMFSVTDLDWPAVRARLMERLAD